MAATEKFTVIPIDGPRADALLEHINIDRWDRGRPAELLRLVAYLGNYPQWTAVWRWQIEGLGRTARQARYDHEVMIRLAADRVLQRAARRGGDLWRVNPDLRHWRGVPGIPSWRRVVSLFSDPLSDICARSGPNRAGQRLVRMPDWSPFQDVEGVPLSATNLVTVARNMARGARSPGITQPEHGAPRAPGAPPIPSCLVIPSSSCEPGQEEEAEKLVEVVKTELGLAFLEGKQRDALVRLCRDYPEHVSDFVALAPAVIAAGGLRWPSMVAVVLRERAATGRWELEPTPDEANAEHARRKRRDQLPRLIASAREQGAEESYIDRLVSELEDLEGE